MTSIVAGRTETLTVEWRTFDGGPLVALDSAPTITITRISDSTIVVGPTVVGVTTPAVGINGYVWPTDSTLTAGGYTVAWSGTYAAAPVYAVELVTVTPALSSAYATAADYTELTANTPPANIALLLRRASRSVDGILLSAVYDTADVDVLTALREATVEQVQYCLDNGWDEGIPTGYDEVTIASVKLKRAAGSNGSGGQPAAFSGEAFIILQLAGLTGMAPWTG